MTTRDLAVQMRELAEQQRALQARVDELLAASPQHEQLVVELVYGGHIVAGQAPQVREYALKMGIDDARAFFRKFVALEPAAALERLRQLTHEISLNERVSPGDAGILAIARHPALAMQANRAADKDDAFERRFAQARGLELELLASARSK